MKASPATIARNIVDELFAAGDAARTSDARMNLFVRIESAIRAAIDDERAECAGVCDRRQQFWERCAASMAPAAAEEVRARAAEAGWLADAVRARSDDTTTEN
jgi:hypothetical protein